MSRSLLIFLASLLAVLALITSGALAVQGIQPLSQILAGAGGIIVGVLGIKAR